MIRRSEKVFVDTGAWIALALAGDPLHDRALVAWDEIDTAQARLHLSIPVVIETFTFLERNATRDVALTWRDAVLALPRLRVLECRRRDLDDAWKYFERRDLHKLSVVDATSFTLMTRLRIRVAFAFDHHFASAGFRLVG